MPARGPSGGNDDLLLKLVGSLEDLGEIKGQLRELIHNSNANGAKLDALGIRVNQLETERSRREGAAGIVKLVLKSPLIGWLVGAAVSAWAILTGKVHI